MPKSNVPKVFKRIGRAFSTGPTTELPGIYPVTPGPTPAQLAANPPFQGHNAHPVVAPPTHSTPPDDTMKQLLSFPDPLLTYQHDPNALPPLVNLVLSQSLSNYAKSFPHSSGTTCNIVTSILEPLLKAWTTEVDSFPEGRSKIEKHLSFLENECYEKKPTSIPAEGNRQVRQFIAETYIPCITQCMKIPVGATYWKPEWESTANVTNPHHTAVLEPTLGLVFKNSPRHANLACAVLEFETEEQAPGHVFDAIEEAFDWEWVNLVASGAVELDEKGKKFYDKCTQGQMTRALGRIWSYMRANKCRVGVLSTLKNTLVFYVAYEKLRIATRLKHGVSSPYDASHSLLTLLLAITLMHPNDLILRDPPPPPTFSAFRV
ncbi:hypothetical protein M231_03498 [Tremella mesenterica]|uniref:Uncharacterized protein n=1 Tax=Tremella mesenterica TaxID=5217 RepID=A0A4Q1BN51_TREME|nr:hypothetical protein M231_03498 [Tremella mesenterica]